MVVIRIVGRAYRCQTVVGTVCIGSIRGARASPDPVSDTIVTIPENAPGSRRVSQTIQVVVQVRFRVDALNISQAIIGVVEVHQDVGPLDCLDLFRSASIVIRARRLDPVSVSYSSYLASWRVRNSSERYAAGGHGDHTVHSVDDKTHKSAAVN